jgi:Spy/CpxP family protein refolding chaperone
MTKLRSLRENSQKQFRALLTEQQRTKYDQILQQRASATSAASQASSSSQTSTPSLHDEKDAH